MSETKDATSPAEAETTQSDPPAQPAPGDRPEAAEAQAPVNDAAPGTDTGEPSDPPEANADADADADADANKRNAVEPPDDLTQRVEAALLTSDRALSAGKLGEALGGLNNKTITDAIDQLNQAYEQTGRSFRIEPVAGGWKVMTLPAYSDVLDALHQKRSENKLSAAALETLAIIAYKQPVLRAEIESIRGAASGEIVRSLMDRHLIKIVGRAEEIGRPMLYGTTKTFLEVFGLASLKDLPQVEQLKPNE